MFSYFWLRNISSKICPLNFLTLTLKSPTTYLFHIELYLSTIIFAFIWLLCWQMRTTRLIIFLAYFNNKVNMATCKNCLFYMYRVSIMFEKLRKQIPLCILHRSFSGLGFNIQKFLSLQSTLVWTGSNPILYMFTMIKTPVKGILHKVDVYKILTG